MTKKVVFVCVENSGRSLLAEALFNERAPDGWMAMSSGVTPAKTPNPYALRVLEEIGIPTDNLRPKAIEQAALKEAKRIITVCGADFCPAAHLPKVEKWNIEDLKGMPLEEVRRIRDLIRGKVADLIERIETEGLSG